MSTSRAIRDKNDITCCAIIQNIVAIPNKKQIVRRRLSGIKPPSKDSRIMSKYTVSAVGGAPDMSQ